MALLLAMIPMGEGEGFSPAGFVEDARSRWGDEVQLTSDESAACFTWGGVELIVAPMPAPIPWGDLEYLSTVSRMWPGATEDLRGHTTHLVLTGVQDLPAPVLAALGAKATASLLAVTPASLGVYARGPLLVRKDVYVDYATKVVPMGVPVDLWVDIYIGGSSTAESAGYTLGLDAFGMMEFEAPASPETQEELRDRLWSLAGYVLENGPVILDGHTVGENNSERIRVSSSDSEFGLPGKVLRLHYA